MEFNLSKSIGLGIVVTLITNLGGVSAGRSAIIGASVMLFVRSFIWTNNWIKTVNEKLSNLSDSKTVIPTVENTNKSVNNTENSFTFNFTEDSVIQKAVKSKENNRIIPANKYEDIN